MEPKKPCSGNYPYARIRFTDGDETTCSVPGDGMMQKVKEHSIVLVMGGGQKQLPGVKYSLVPGAQDLAGGPPQNSHTVNGQVVTRKQGRSKYGVKRKK
jgi:small subunit ribosomal protein S12